MKIWAHRGCSLNYPENTLPAFRAATKLNGLAGIELDIQLTADNKIVVIHDETVDRTTNGKGFVKEYTLSGLKKLRIKRKWWRFETIPTMEEVLELLEEAFSKGLLLNIELCSVCIRWKAPSGANLQGPFYTKRILLNTWQHGLPLLFNADRP